MMMFKFTNFKICLLILVGLLSHSCVRKNPSIKITPHDFYGSVDRVTETMIHDIFSPPVAHWMGITKIACKNSNYGFQEAVYAHTKNSIAIFEAFISCWDEKYRSNLIRPETLINQFIDKKWKPILQTPPFPEYTSGHSVVSGASSKVLTSIFGSDFKFSDDTEVPFSLPIRTFKSFNDAADEAAISRLYGGIHYKSAIDEGLKQGRQIGDFVIDRLNMINYFN